MLTISEWGELCVLEEALSDWMNKRSPRKDPRYNHARELLPKVRKELVDATERLNF